MEKCHPLALCFFFFFFRSYYTDIWPFLFTGSLGFSSRTQWCWMLIPFRYFADGLFWEFVDDGLQGESPCSSFDGLALKWALWLSEVRRVGDSHRDGHQQLSVSCWEYLRYLQRTPGWWQGAERTGLCVAAGGTSLSACYLVCRMGIGSTVSWWTECCCILPLLLLDADLASSQPGAGQGMKLRGRILGAPTTGGDFGWVQYEVSAIAPSKKGPLVGISL